MNINAKLLKQHKQTEFNNSLKRIIHHDQMGFSPGIREWFDTHKSINMKTPQKQNEKKKNHMIIPIGAEKAFNTYL